MAAPAPMHREAVALGTLLTAVVQGILVGLSFAFTGLPSPVVFGVLASLAALVPVVGSSLVWVPAAFVHVAHDRVGAALFLTVMAINFLGDALRDALDPHLQARQARASVDQL